MCNVVSLNMHDNAIFTKKKKTNIHLIIASFASIIAVGLFLSSSTAMDSAASRAPPGFANSDTRPIRFASVAEMGVPLRMILIAYEESTS